jgi:hypothetical protein
VGGTESERERRRRKRKRKRLGPKDFSTINKVKSQAFTCNFIIPTYSGSIMVKIFPYDV